MRGGGAGRRAEGRGVEGDQHLGPARRHGRQPVAAAVLHQHGVVGGRAVVEDEAVALARALAPRPHCATCLV